MTSSQNEEIPLSVVRDFDMMDDGDPEVPPQFSCEACREECTEVVFLPPSKSMEHDFNGWNPMPIPPHKPRQGFAQKRTVQLPDGPFLNESFS